MRAGRKLALITAIALAIPAQAGAPAEYHVRAELLHKGDVYAAPSLVLRDGDPAVASVTGEAGYRFEIEVTATQAGDLAIATRIESARGEIAPTMTIQPNAPATVTIGDLGLTLTVSSN